jgi:hypothetical protein
VSSDSPICQRCHRLYFGKNKTCMCPICLEERFLERGKEVADLRSQLKATNDRAEKAQERVNVLERALEIACKYTERPYTDSMGSALPCDNNGLNCPQCFIAQAKEVRP